MPDQVHDRPPGRGADPAEPAGVEAWAAFYDRVEQALLVLAERMAAGAEFTEPAWGFLPPPTGPVPAGLLPRRERILARLALLTDAIQIRMTAVRRELDTLPPRTISTPGTIAVGRALDVFG